MKSGPARFRRMRLLPVIALSLLSLVAGPITAVPAQASPNSGPTYTDLAGNTVTLNSKTVLLEAESLDVLRSSSSRRIVFDNANFSLAERIGEGTVVIVPASTNVQMLYVNSVEVRTDRLVVEGRPATLTEAYADLRIKRNVRFDAVPRITSESVAITSSSMVVPRSGATWSYRFLGTRVGEPDSGNTAEVGVFLSGSFSLEPEVQVDVDLRASRYAFTMAAKPSVTLSVEAKSSFSVNAPVSLAKIDFQRKVFFVGPVPVELHPQVSLDLTLEASGSAGVSARVVDYSQEVRVGVEYADGSLRNTSQPIDPKLGFRQPRLDSGTASAEGSVTLSAELFVNLYELAGPTLTLEFVATLYVQPREAVWARLVADANIKVGGRVAILGSDGGPEVSFDIAPGLGPWEVWKATPRDPLKFTGIVGFSKPMTRMGVNGYRCVDVDLTGVDPSTVKWGLPQAAIAAGVRLSTSDVGAPLVTEVTGSHACIFSGSQAVQTFVDVLHGTSRTPIRHTVEVALDVVNPPRRAEKVTATAQYESAEVSWTSGADPSYWTVTATTTDRKVPASRRSVTQTAWGTARSVRLEGLASRIDYVVTVHGVNDAGEGPSQQTKVRPLGRILLVGPSARLGTWSDGVGKDSSSTTEAQATGLMILANGTSALALVPASRIKRGAIGTTLARLRLKDGSIDWYAKGADGNPLSVWRGSTTRLTDRAFIANPSGTSVIAYQCLEITASSCTGHFTRLQPNMDLVTKLPDAIQDGFWGLVAQGVDTEADWAMSSNGRFVVTGIGSQVSLWDLDRGSRVSSMWNEEACGDGRCGGAVHSVGITTGNRVLVSALNTPTSEHCLNGGDLWEWTPASGERRVVSPTQPGWVLGAGSRQMCVGASRFVLPVGAASASRVALYEVDGSRTSAWLVDLTTRHAWSAPTFRIPVSLAFTRPHLSDVHKKLSLSANGQVMAVPVTIAAESGFYAPSWVGVHVCHFLARVCTLSMANQGTLDWFNAALWGGVHLSGTGNRLVFLGVTETPSRRTWWRQDLNPKVS